MNARPIELRWLWLIIGAGVLARMTLSFSFDHLWMSGNGAPHLFGVASSVAAGEGMSYLGRPDTDAFPLYPLLLGIFFAIFGADWLAGMWLNLSLYVAFALTVYALGKELFDARVGLLAALIASFYPYLVWHHIYVGETILFVWLVNAVMLILVRLLKNPDWRGAVLLGVVFAMAGLTRSTVLAFLPLAMIYLGWRLRSGRLPLIVLLATILSIAPWTVRNHVVADAFIPISTHAGWPLSAGNNLATADYLRERLSTDYITRDQRLTAPPGLNAVDKNAWFMQQVKDFYLDNPGAALELIGMKAWIFWSWELYPLESAVRVPENRTDYFDPSTIEELSRIRTEGMTNQQRVKRWMYTLTYLPLLLLGLWGLWLARRRKDVIVPVLLLFFAFTVLHSLSLPFTRTRIPLDPLLGIFAASAVMAWWRSRTASSSE